MLRALLIPLLAAAGAAQSVIYPETVLTRMPGLPAAVLLEVDPIANSIVPLPGFASDGLDPLAVTRDPYDRSIYVALDIAGTASVVVRLDRAGPVFVETILSALAGRAVGLAIAGDSLFVGVDAPNGGVYRLPRRGGALVQTIVQPNLTAMHGYGPGQATARLAWTGRSGTSQPSSGAAIVDADTGLIYLGPLTFANPNSIEVTAIADTSTLVPRHVLSFSDGTFAEVFNFTGPVTPIQISPVPAGGAIAMQQGLGFANNPIVLGSASYPHLYVADTTIGFAILLSPALPGDPVDFARGQDRGGHSIAFGDSCGPNTLAQSTSGLAQPGSTLTVTVQGPPNLATLVALGFDDYANGALPLAIPGGCLVHINPVTSVFHPPSASGFASQSLPIPPGPGFLGVILFSQWFEPTALSASTAAAHWIGF